jgi:hypothetical protein
LRIHANIDGQRSTVPGKAMTPIDGAISMSRLDWD